MVFLMVAACVIFVGALSLAAVAVASHAAHPAGPGGTMDTDTATPSVTPPGAPHAKGSNSMTPASRI